MRIEPPNTAAPNENASREEGVEPPNASEEVVGIPLYNEAVREQELIQLVEPPRSSQSPEHQINSLLAAQQLLLAARRKRSCEITLVETVIKKPREI